MNESNGFFNFDAVVEIEKKKSYNKALDDVLKLIATLGIDYEVKNCDIYWLEKSVERLRK